MKISTLALLLAAAITPDVHYFRYERSILDTPTQQAQTCIALDATVFAHAEPRLSDLRLYQGEKEVPYAVGLATPVEATQNNISPLNVGERDGRIVFDAAMPEGTYSDVELDIDARDFIASVDVFGSQSQADRTPTKLGTYTIFDFMRQKLGRSTVLHLPQTNFRYLHFRVDGPLKPEEVTGLRFSGFVKSQPQYIATAETSQVVQQGHETLIAFTVPAHVPVARVVFAGGQQPVNFSRNVTVTVAEQGVASSGESTLSPSEGNILRIHATRNGRRIDEERLSVDSPARDGGRPTKWMVKVDNGDDPPLALESVRLEMLERNLCFDAKPGAMYSLYYGDPALSAPRYDYATLFTPEKGAKRGTLGPERENPGYHPRPDERPLTERHPALLWTALGLVVLILGGIALQSAKRINSQ